LCELNGAYRNQIQATAASSSGGQPSFSGYAIICVAHPLPCKAGQVQLLYRDAGGQPAGSDQCLAIAQKWRDKAASMYGGDWEILGGQGQDAWTLDQLQDESRRLRHGATIEGWPAARERLDNAAKARYRQPHGDARPTPVDMTGLRSRFGAKAEQAPEPISGPVASVMAGIE
jgi:hypothetical protein